MEGYIFLFSVRNSGVEVFDTIGSDSTKLFMSEYHGGYWFGEVIDPDTMLSILGMEKGISSD